MDSKSEDHKKEAILDSTGNEVDSNGESDSNEPWSADNGCLIKVRDVETGFRKVTVTTGIALLAEEGDIA